MRGQNIPHREVTIRAVRDDDSAALLRILAAVYAEYPGCLLELSEVPELMAPATSFAENGGQFWVAEQCGAIVGFIAMTPSGEPDRIELKKLYVLAKARGIGLGRRLIALVEEAALTRGARGVHLWSDTRFKTAHRVYERCAYVRLPETRELHDVSNSIEYHYEKMLT